ncbi:hypothetical protein PCANC_19964 [Puccinia coronata f. sp. avenae]|uniref:Uncharacterized protein n=2 Tax=Puccinia coronata f. sp. avenae TaxID=200324 RepID=A0A2N5SKY2_9BASI|nr:hypothetical protein PCANC_19964 [Puccinia coronata f. sp. avenae]
MSLPMVFGTASPLLTMIPSQMLSQVPTTPAGGGISPSPDPNTTQLHKNLSNNPASQPSRGRGHGRGRGCGGASLWRLGSMSKRDVAELVLIYLAKNDFENHERNWKGVEQQISQLEKKFWDALAFKEQTGQGIIEEAEEAQKEAGDAGNDSGAENFIENAKNKTEAMIRKQCPYYYELEPVMGDLPSAAPQHASEQGNGDVSDGPSDNSNTDKDQVPADVDVSNDSSSSDSDSLPDAPTSQSQPNCTPQQVPSGSRRQPVQS